MFHRQGYECEIEKIKLRKIEEDKKAADARNKASHADGHEEAHAKGLPHTH